MTKQVQVSFRPNVFEILDSMARFYGCSRSALVTRCVVDYYMRYRSEMPPSVRCL